MSLTTHDNLAVPISWGRRAQLEALGNEQAGLIVPGSWSGWACCVTVSGAFPGFWDARGEGGQG